MYGLETLSEVMDQLAAGQIAALQSHRSGHAGRRLEACVSFWSFCPTAKGLYMGRDELELITGELRHEMPLIKFLDEGRAPWGNCSHAKCKGQDKGKHSDKRKGRPERASPKENPAESKASSV